MPAWIYKRFPTATHMDQVDEAVLRRMIRGNGLTGTELVRPAEGPGDWVPLHSMPIFRDTLGLPAEADAAKVASSRKGRRVGAVMGILAALMAMGFAGGIVSSATSTGGAVPGTGVALTIGAAFAVLVAAGAASFALTGAKKNATTNLAKVTIKAPAAQPERIDEVERALGALDAALKTAPPALRSAIPIASLQESARRLKKNRELLASLPAEEARQALNAELEAAKARAAAATNPDASDAFGDQIRGIEAHLRSIDGAASAIAETEARARALLHEVEALRVDVLRAGTDSTVDDEILERLHAIRRELEAESAIEEQLSRSAPAQRAMGPAAQKS